MFFSPSTDTSTISNITLKSASSVSYTLVTSTIVSQNNAEREEVRKLGRYNFLTIGYYSHFFLQICVIYRTRGEEFRKYSPKVFEPEENKATY